VNRHRQRRDRRRWARIAGDILLTLGVFVLLMLVYQLWWTNVQAARAAEQASTEVQAAWVAPTPTPSTPPQGATSAPAAVDIAQPKVGTPFGLMYIPRLSDKAWGLPVIQGVGAEQLSQGVGHYVDTAMPGQLGNFATAAHRATNGEPFRDIDRLKKGDRVVVETRAGWFTYELDKDKIVLPTDTWVIDPVPGQPDATPTEALITLTTCNPRWASYERWIWWGHLVESRGRSQGPPAEIANGKGG
jgi:sortase A